MMCGFGSASEIAQCLLEIKSWVNSAWPFIQALNALLGIGTIGVIFMLFWYLKRARRDIEKSEQTSGELRASSQSLRGTLKQAMEEKTAAQKQANLAMSIQQRQQDQLDRALAPTNDQISQLTAENTILNTKIEGIRTASSGDATEFWERPVGPRLEDYETGLRDSIPVILFANQKGGVGKTTLSANIAACFAKRGERVLAIDLDYQGSMTGLMLAQADERPEEFPSMIDLLHAPSLNELWPHTAIQTAWRQNTKSENSGNKGNLDYISCWYSFERLERNMEYLWLLGESGDDIRFRLARAILSDYVQTHYDRVIIDAPPRITSGFINGFCASTHLFVPTVVDHVSARAVGTFSRRFSKLVPILNPVLKFSGIVATMTSSDHIPQNAQAAASLAEHNVQKALNTPENYLMRDAVMRRSMKIPYSTDAGVPYLQDEQTHPMFDRIADEVARRAPLRT